MKHDFDPQTADRAELLSVARYDLAELFPNVPLLGSPRLLAVLPEKKLRALVVSLIERLAESIE